ncbi:antirestriction protein [Citrobacter freundii]|nr:antirestriction protein [Citrobacter freundii]
MFQDWEGIPSQFASESSVDWDFIDAYKQAKDVGKDAAFIAWAEYSGECDFDAFEDAYYGEAVSEEDFAVDYVNEHSLLAAIPESLHGYFDYDAFARDLFIDTFNFIDGYVFRR